MRYALISDIHGNLHALLAVLEDVRRMRIDQILFLGDYYADFPYPNEVADLVLRRPDALAVRGNKEDYLANYTREDSSTWCSDQLAALHWNYRSMRPDVLREYLNMPMSLGIQGERGMIHLAHASRAFFPKTAVSQLDSYALAKHGPHDHSEYLRFAKAKLDHDPAFGRLSAPYRGRAVLFGHSHIQWYAESNGVTLVNPGSVGLPLDFDVRAAYSILDDTDGRYAVEERRVEYDIVAARNAVLHSPSYPLAQVWYDLVLLELRTAEDHVNDFFRAIKQYAIEHIGTAQEPFPNEIWNRAGRRFLDSLADARDR